jgi:hypothetical protein
VANKLVIYQMRRLGRLTLSSSISALLGTACCIAIASSIAEPARRPTVDLALPQPGGSTYVYFDPGDCLTNDR